METVSIHQVEAHLADLINRLANEGGFIIAKNRKPLAKLVPISAEGECNAKRLGFVAGELRLPEDFDRTSGDGIERLFCGPSDP